MSKIEWTEQTWNPLTGCTKISPGCKNCYAETMSARLTFMSAGYENGFELTARPERLQQPLQRKRPTTYFVCSMSDLFHEDLRWDYIDKVFEVIKLTPQHTYQILTKRAVQMREYFEHRTVPPNAWIGVSVEDQKYGLPRIEHLQAINAQVRFLSVEPLLEDLGELPLDGIHWVIVGGESSAKARPMSLSWVTKIRDQCIQKNVAFFFKQWGSFGPDGIKRHKARNGRELENQIWDMMPNGEVCPLS